MEVHQTALISPRAKIGKDCKFGPFCIVEDDAEIGDNSVFESFSVVKKGSIVGSDNYVCEGAVIGGFPQCLGLEETRGLAIVGNGNIIRENVTIHRSMKDSDATLVGDSCMLMVNVHVAHDCKIGNNIVIANNVMLAGHVMIEDRVNISGAVGVHQFCRIGKHAMVGGQSHIAQDVPPFVTVDGKTSSVVGLNLIGLRRTGFSTDQIKTLKAVYRLLYNRDLSWAEKLRKMEVEYPDGLGYEMFCFLKASTRGILRDRRSLRLSGELGE